MASTLNASTSSGLISSGDTSGVLAFQTNSGTTAVTIDTSQNVAVGNTSPQAKLSVGAGTTAPGYGYTAKMLYVCDTTQPEVLIRETTGSVVTSMYADSSTGNLRTATNHPLVFATNNTERMRIDSSGNVGVGVTPSSWSSGYRALQFGVGGTKYFSVSGNSAGAADGNLLWNAYSTGNETFAYITTGDVVTRFRQSGDFTWSTAPSGTAGGAITFVDRMKLDSSGNLKFNSGYGSAATAYGCRAWVNFDGTSSSPSIRASGNVSSVTKNSTGDYVVNFTSSMPDINYAVVGMTQATIGSTVAIPVASVTSAVGSVRVRATSGGIFYDGDNVSVVVFR
jgi:hypothetical protein